MFNEINELQQVQSGVVVTKEILDKSIKNTSLEFLDFIVQYVNNSNNHLNFTKIRNAVKYYDVGFIFENEKSDDLDSILKWFEKWKENLREHSIQFFDKEKGFNTEERFRLLTKRLIQNTYHLIQYHKICEYLYNCNKNEARWTIKFLIKDVDDKTKELLVLMQNEKRNNPIEQTNTTEHP